MTKFINVVADIGGTNIRLGIASSDNKITQLTQYKCAEYDSLEQILTLYLNKIEALRNQVRLCLAIACPVDKDTVKMTNLPWQFSKVALKASLGINQLLVINDYTAIALSIALLGDDQLVKIGGGEKQDHQPISICGPGTGLGVANLVPYLGDWISIGGEGGHVDFAPVDDTEIAILKFLKRKYSRVSAEQLLSGLGIEQIYQALCDLQDMAPESLKAAEITQKALSDECALCKQALNQFCKTLGSFAGNLSLTMSSFGGVYIAGGIVPRFTEFLENSEFRKRFEDKGRFVDFNRQIPTYVITESQPGILGACAYLRQYNKEDL